jgi:hypothetical protein
MRNTPIGIPEGATLKDKGRRQHVRKLVDTPMRYTDRFGLSSGVIRDIGLGGAFILTRRAFFLRQNPSVSFFPFQLRENRSDHRRYRESNTGRYRRPIHLNQ